MGDDEQQELTAPSDVTEGEIEVLVSGIDRARIVELVKHTPYLQQHVFRGFRPSRLPWNQVPTRLARDASGDPGKTGMLVTLWRKSNRDLLEEVQDISPDRIREGVAELLTQRGVESRFQVLWALKLDRREEIRRALEADLADEIAAETSELLSQVQRAVLVTALEAAQKRAAELQERLTETKSDLDDDRRLLRRKNEQIAAAQAKMVELEEERDQLLARTDELAQVQERLETELLDVQRQLADEKAANAELRKSVRDLKATLQIQAESSRQEEEGTQQQVNEALLALEEQRRETASLRLKLGKLEQQLATAYARREEEREQNEALKRQLQKLRHDKEVIIEEKRRLTRGRERLQSELDDAHRQLQDQAIRETMGALPLSELEDRWLKEREAVRDYLHALMDSLRAENETPSSSADKWGLWSQWLEREASLVRGALTNLEKEANLDSVNSLESAQQLLALRWYLLEYTRRAVRSALEESMFPL